MSESDLIKILDLNNFTKRLDRFNIGQENECDKSISWKDLDKIKNRDEYIKKLKEINTNPKYEVFHQIYFHAADNIQFQKYGLLNSKLLSFPNRSSSIKDFKLYNGYNLNTTYNTFLYLFNKLKKGIYISIKDNELQTYLPFSNINYKNNWANVLKDLNSDTLNFLKSRFYNVSDPEFWYANNCFFNTNKLYFTSDGGKGKGKGKGKSKGKGGRGKEYLEEGDKTETIFKYFLKYFLEDLNKQEKKNK